MTKFLPWGYNIFKLVPPPSSFIIVSWQIHKKSREYGTSPVFKKQGIWGVWGVWGVYTVPVKLTVVYLLHALVEYPDTSCWAQQA